jgi:hypothetical protein
MTQEQEDEGKNGNLAFEAFKHLTTLSAGSIVVIGTFLSDIFPKDEQGNLLVDSRSKFLIAASFIFFGLSLAASAYSMYWFASRDVPSWFRSTFVKRLIGERRYTRMLSFLMPSAGAYFFFGLVCFGVAVLVHLFSV